MAIDLSTVRSEVKPSLPPIDFEVSAATLRRLDLPEDVLKDKKLVHSFLANQFTGYYNLVYRPEIKAPEGDALSPLEAFGPEYTKTTAQLGSGDLTEEEAVLLDEWMTELRGKTGFGTASAGGGEAGFSAADGGAPQYNYQEWNQEVQDLYQELLKSGKLNQAKGSSTGDSGGIPSMEELLALSNLQFEANEVDDKYQKMIDEALATKGGGILAILLRLEQNAEKTNMAMGKLLNALGAQDQVLAKLESDMGLQGTPSAADMQALQIKASQSMMGTNTILQLIQKLQNGQDRLVQMTSSTLNIIHRSQEVGVGNLRA